MQITPVICTLINLFIANVVVDYFLSGIKNGYKFEVITDNPEELCKEIINNLQHGATLMKGKGVYSNNEKSVLIAVINYYQVAEFLSIISRQNNTFAYYVDVMGVKGNFDWVKQNQDENNNL